jgi:hypothetical protein
MSSTPRGSHETIERLYRAGLPVAAIAHETSVCMKTVRNVARRAGLPPRHPTQPRRDRAVIERYVAGDRVADIAAEHGISTSRVRRIAARAGVPPRSEWRRRYPIDETAFRQPSAIGWWLIGLLAADGSVHAAEQRVSLCQTMEDADVLHAFYEYVGCPGRPITMLNLSEAVRTRQLPRRPAGEARIFSKHIVAALATHGVVPRKSATMKLGAEASRQCAVWLGLLDGDGSVGIYREGRAPKLAYFGTRALMNQCEEFWRRELPFEGARPAAIPHSKGLWTFTLWGTKATLAARLLLAATPTSMRRKRALLVEIAERNVEAPLCLRS